MLIGERPQCGDTEKRVTGAASASKPSSVTLHVSLWRDTCPWYMSRVLVTWHASKSRLRVTLTRFWWLRISLITWHVSLWHVTRALDMCHVSWLRDTCHSHWGTEDWGCHWITHNIRHFVVTFPKDLITHFHTSLKCLQHCTFWINFSNFLIFNPV